jgi:plasmid stability protein
MSAISIRNIPESTYQALKDMAARNERSLQEQVRYLLEQEVKLVNRSSLVNARAWRKRLQNRSHSNVVDMIREDRCR